ncbi:hypothetical protein K435DRAFT_235447 [Dendrothele bispora CBS 962.96]|uniref:Uncharacterized protein n=1 Tax=Dendrothele bispora (strain CBS 962.96) TaxID=1314807 RepID=A0A4S8LPM7_DENBC|nr:hypothetical protein K435DRAFT_235447 [Dendrothele bispora CBS 962.96]
MTSDETEDIFMSITDSFIQTPDVSIPLSDPDSIFLSIPGSSPSLYESSLEDPFLVGSSLASRTADHSTTEEERGRARARTQSPSVRSRSSSRTRPRMRSTQGYHSRSQSKSRSRINDRDTLKSSKHTEKPPIPPRSAERPSRGLKLSLLVDRPFDTTPLKPSRPPRSAKRNAGSRPKQDSSIVHVPAKLGATKPLSIEKAGKSKNKDDNESNHNTEEYKDVMTGSDRDTGSGLFGDQRMDIACTVYACTGVADSFGGVGSASVSDSQYFSHTEAETSSVFGDGGAKTIGVRDVVTDSGDAGLAQYTDMTIANCIPDSAMARVKRSVESISSLSDDRNLTSSLP